MTNDIVMIEQLQSLWKMVDCQVTFRGHARFVTWLPLLRRFRGAMGHILAASASSEALAGKACPFSPPCAFDLFHNCQGNIEPGLEIPKPFVLRADANGDDLRITLRLFGDACRWSGEFHAAVIAAGRRGIEREKGAPLILTPVLAAQCPAALEELPKHPPVAIVHTITPIKQHNPRHADDHGIDPATLITGLGNRVRGLARWHGMDITFNSAALRENAARIGCGASIEKHRSRSTSPNRFEGTIRYPTPDPVTAALLQLGEAAHLAGDSTKGAGRIALNWV